MDFRFNRNMCFIIKCWVLLFLQFVVGVHLSRCDVLISKDGFEMSYRLHRSNDSCQTDAHRIKFQVGIPLSDCVLECGLRKHCLALTYHHGTQGCHLLRSVDNNDVNNTDCDVILRHDFNISKLPCTNVCEEGYVCDSNTQSCEIKECPRPSPINGNVLGNDFSVGSRVQYKCHPGSKDFTGTYQATCSATGTWSYVANCSYIRDCTDYRALGYNESGVYDLHLPTGQRMSVLCQMASGSNSWIVIQRRVNASDFYKRWNEYKNGFGDLNGNFWLGNEKIRALTSQGNWRLKIELGYDGERGFAKYDSFALSDETHNYTLIIGQYLYINNDIGDSLILHNGSQFSTKDKDNDNSDIHCAEMSMGGWWYIGWSSDGITRCHMSNLNGMYGNTENGNGLTWSTWQGYNVSMTSTMMKIRNINKDPIDTNNAFNLTSSSSLPNHL